MGKHNEGQGKQRLTQMPRSQVKGSNEKKVFGHKDRIVVVKKGERKHGK